MTWGFVGAAAVTVVGGMVSANQSRQAAKGAAGAQERAAQAGIDEQQRQFEAVQKLMAPYVQAGTGALGGQQAILGLSGPEAQQAAIDALAQGPQYKMLVQQGENAMLQLIDQQYGRLGGMAQLGQASAAGQAAQGMQLGQNVAGLLGQQGQAQAGGYLAQGAANSQLANTASQMAMTYLGKKF